MEFKGFPKLARLNREMVITEKLDGTNASIFIQHRDLEKLVDDTRGNMVNIPDSNIIAVSNDNQYTMRVGSRTRWIIPGNDNYAFAQWCQINNEELFKLGEGHHFGEWWGSGIQRGYNLPKGEKRFSLFNTARWADDGTDVRPLCCHVVPVLYKGIMNTNAIDYTLIQLIATGSIAALNYDNPEGIVVFHTAANQSFKITIKDDESPKSLIK